MTERLETQKREIEMALRLMGITLDQLADRLHLKRESLRKYAGGYQPASERIMKSIQTLRNLAVHSPAEFRASIERSQEPDNSPRGKFRAALRRAGLDAAALAEKISYPIAEVQDVVEGHGEITEAMAERICKTLPSLTLEDLLHGSDWPRVVDETGTTGTFGSKPNIALPPGMRAQFVPLLSYAQAGAMTEWTDDLYSHEGVLAIDLPNHAKAFALPLRGDSMEPRFREGDVAVVLYGMEPHNGEVVVACKKSGEVMCKLYTEAGTRVVLTSYNERFHPPVQIRRSELRWVYPVHSVIQKLRR